MRKDILVQAVKETAKDVWQGVRKVLIFCVVFALLVAAALGVTVLAATYGPAAVVITAISAAVVFSLGAVLKLNYDYFQRQADWIAAMEADE